VPDDEHLTAPALFVGDGYLTGDRIRGPAIEALIGPYLSSGVAEAWTGWETEQDTSEGAILERFRSFGLLTVVGAGLLDGVNPCAFATMIFLISYLSVRKREGAELLATGAAFTSGVFLTYLGVGFGFLRFLSSLSFLAIIGKWVYGVTLLLCLALAWGSFFDYRKAKEGRLSDMSLKLPDRLRGWIRTLIREGSSARRFVLSSFAMGFAVSIVELACTGQVYLPTIIFVLGVPEWRAQASVALVLYNIMFILPLIGVFLLVYFGTTSRQLSDWGIDDRYRSLLPMDCLNYLLRGRQLMISRNSWVAKTVILCLSVWVLAGCSPASESAAQPTESVPGASVEMPVPNVPLPPATPTVVASPAENPTVIPTATPTAPKPTTVVVPEKAVSLTILHTNDSRGYVDLCG